MNLYEVRYYTLSDGRGRLEVKAMSSEMAKKVAKIKDPMLDAIAAVDVYLIEGNLTFCPRCQDFITRKEMRHTLADDDTYRHICPGCDEELLPPTPFDGLRL